MGGSSRLEGRCRTLLLLHAASRCFSNYSVALKARFHRSLTAPLPRPAALWGPRRAAVERAARVVLPASAVRKRAAKPSVARARTRARLRRVAPVRAGRWARPWAEQEAPGEPRALVVAAAWQGAARRAEAALRQPPI